MNDRSPVEPPLAGTEVDQLLGSLDRLRGTFRWKAGGLDAAGLATRVGTSSLTLGGLLKHLALVEDDVSLARLTGGDLGGIWGPLGHDGSEEWELRSAADDSPEHLYAVYDDAVARARERWAAVVAERGLDGAAHLSDDAGRHPSVRRVLCDLLEEYGRHTGHADLIRESVDGLVGEDPPG